MQLLFAVEERGVARIFIFLGVGVGRRVAEISSWDKSQGDGSEVFII